MSDIDLSSLMRRVQRLQLKARGAVRETLAGSYSSCFKGQGIDFEDFRPYEPGDEIRNIDWNVTARHGHPFVRQFIEERELSVFLVVDISGSNEFGSVNASKRERMAELASCLAFSACHHQDRVGLVLFSNRVDLFLPSKKGINHMLRVLREILHQKASSGMTNLGAALGRLSHPTYRRSLVFVLSDFVSTDFTRSLKTISRQHDVIALQVIDPAERNLPKVGRVRLHDTETGRQQVVDTTHPRIRKEYVEALDLWQKALNNQFRRLGVDHLTLETEGSYVPQLHAFFKNRSTRSFGI